MAGGWAARMNRLKPLQHHPSAHVCGTGDVLQPPSLSLPEKRATVIISLRIFQSFPVLRQARNIEQVLYTWFQKLAFFFLILSSCEAFVKSKRNSERHSQPEKAGWKMGLFKLMWATTAPTCYCVHQGENLISSQNAVYQCCALLNIYFLPPHPCPGKTARSRG